MCMLCIPKHLVVSVRLLLLIGLILAGLTIRRVGFAQTIEPPSRAVDLMLIIDNSCSMYEIGHPMCGPGDSIGSDPDNLRVTGANLFAARMAFSEALQSQDRIGVIHMGTRVEVVYPLSPIEQSREAVPLAVADPNPMGGTQVIGALQKAYTILQAESSSGNRPAIVFLTDGVPYPAQGQSFAEIEALVRENSNIPVYLLLLQNFGTNVPEDEIRNYNEYIGKWQQLAQRVENVKVYVIPDYDNLLETYYNIVADMTARPYGPSPVTLESGQSLDFYVGRYARRVYVTVIQLDLDNRGEVKITDKSGRVVQESEDGVRIFRRPTNEVEVYLAYGPRLAGQTDGIWNVRAVNAKLSVFIDVQGAYVFNWLAPKAVPNDLLPGVFMLNDPVNPASDLEFMFNLLIDENQAVLEPQMISGDLLFPDGSTYALRVPANFSPDSQGVYRLPFRLADYSSEPLAGRFEITLRSDDPKQSGSVRQSVATIKIWMEADPDAPVVSVTPTLPPTVVISPTMTPGITPTVSAPVTPVTPITTPTPCPNPPFCKSTVELIGIGLLIILGGMVVVYVMLRLFRKTPGGFVVVYENGSPRGGKISLKSKGKRKFWSWWKVTVGPKGDIRVIPQEAVASADNYMPSSGSSPIKVGGMDFSNLTPAPPTRSGSKEKAHGKRKKRVSVWGEFVYKDGHTRFVNKMSRSHQKLDDTVTTATLGTNVRLMMCTDEKQLQL